MHFSQHRGLSSCRRWATAQGDVPEYAQHCVITQKGTWPIVVPQDPNLPRLQTGLQPLLRPFQWALRSLEARMERTHLEGTLQVDAEDGGAPVQVSCERDLRPYLKAQSLEA